MASLPGPYHKPSFSPKWRKPSVVKMIKDWPPVGARGFDFATAGNNFSTIAKAHHIPNVWDLIIFNFQTEAPREVNWYLHHAVGCWQSSDGMNFSFDDATTADFGMGKIYIPPEGWTPDPRFERGSGKGGEPRMVRETSVRILNRLSSKMPTIYHHATHLPRHAFRIVADLIDVGDVTVHIKPSLKQNGAEYCSVCKKINIGSTVFLFRPFSYGILANEATHVYNHFKSNTTNAFNEEVASSMADSIAMALIDKETSLELMRSHTHYNKWGYMYFLGWVYATHLKDQTVVNLESFNGLYEHPHFGELRNPMEDMIRFHDEQPEYWIKRQMDVVNIWDESFDGFECDCSV
ncbi:hypothetical protein [uncultured Roseibium sp.]|uniref:hypothetical protein n=1 Tax=uncultured Roseibium sp. TaxID=1936171 RepID=UPI00261977FA|nr:hypothetical protein [uncultured Roseibium sp.]